MSHWRKFESKVLENTKRDLLKKALGEMGLELDENCHEIQNSWGHEHVDAGLKMKGRTLSLGINFKQNEGNEQLELTGDFYGTSLNESQFIDKLAQVYQKHNIIQKCEEQGWLVNAENSKMVADGNGNIYLEFEQWG